LWSKSESAMLQQRRADLAGMSIRVIYELLGQSTQAVLERENDGPVVVFTRELTPGLTMELARHKVAGIASSEGTKTSHAAILAQSLGIPCVMGLPAEIEELQQELTVILDGTEGTVIVEPTAQQIRDAETRAEKRHELSLQLREEAGEPAVTKDGVEIGLRGNLDLAEELDLALTQGAEGLGLVRTEFLLMGRSSLPSEDEQFAFYSKVARKFSGRPVTFRSYDLGGDKFPAPFRPPREANPFLGWRAIRVCLDEPSIFLPQLRALLRARAVGDVRLMLPLVTCVEEVDRTRELVAQCAAELKKEGVEAADGLPIGVMVETPAAVVLVEELAQRSDFLSIGTNDLTQYTLVVDRGNARLVGRFEPFHPAVIRQLSKVIDAGFDAGLEVSVCGEMASDPRAAVLLVGLGCKVLSVSPANLPLVKWVVRQIETDKAGEVARNMLSLDATGEVVEALQAVVNGFQGQGSLEMA
ncbi:MAG: phosphoenolpyruvate--protein phosphotransferase, partial [Gemmatimonadota bacterium]|nr:phosphoenolpyruvate--protein phosphotransferase [Gemmatimonadota bacterium]